MKTRKSIGQEIMKQVIKQKIEKKELKQMSKQYQLKKNSQEKDQKMQKKNSEASKSRQKSTKNYQMRQYHLINTKKEMAAYEMWIQILKKNHIPTIKEKLNCQTLLIKRVWIKRGVNTFVYWVHVEVQDSKDQKKGTILLAEEGEGLGLMDVMNGHTWVFDGQV